MQWFQAQEAGKEPQMVPTMVQAQALEEPLQLLAQGMGMIERATAQIRRVIGQASRRPRKQPQPPSGPPPDQLRGGARATREDNAKGPSTHSNRNGSCLPRWKSLCPQLPLLLS